MIATEIKNMKYIILNYIRKYIKLIKKNKFKFLGGFILALFAMITLIDFINLIKYNNVEIIYMVIFIYSLAKLFQDIPVINISHQILEFKLLRLWQVKFLVLIKFLYPSYIILSILYLFPRIFKELNFSILLLLGMINIVSNIICFFISQSKKRGLLRVISVLVLSIVYFYKSVYLGSILMIISIVKLSSIKHINYDLLLPYAHILSNISEGLIDGNTEVIANSQSVLIQSKSFSKLNLIEKYYDSPSHLLFFKEISRAMYYENKIINISVTNFIISLALYIMNINSQLLYIVAFIFIIFICDSFLSVINNVENVNRKNGFYLPYSAKELIVQKYIVHICIIIIPFISSVLLLKNISLFSFIFCLLLLPIRNLTASFYANKKSVSRTINFMIILSCLSTLLF